MLKVNGERQVGAAKGRMSRNFKNWPALWERFMALFSGRTSMLEVQNQALLKSAGERTRRISELERELQQAAEALKWLRAEVERLKAEGERLKGEHEFYHKRVLALEQDNHDLAAVATKYSLWGQKLERELAKIDPDGASARRFGAGHEP